MLFQPDAQHLLDVVANRRPVRLPIYEHMIAPSIMEQVLDVRFAELEGGNRHDLKEFFRHYCRFWPGMGYDGVPYEVCITETLPGRGVNPGGKGPIQGRTDLEKYPWEELAGLYWRHAAPKLEELVRHLPRGVKAVGGVGSGVIEISEELVGRDALAHLSAADPETLAQIYQRIGNLMAEIWAEFLSRYDDTFVICRFGDDLGCEASGPVAPELVRRHVLPQYQRVISTIKRAGKPFLWHSCGCSFSVVDDAIGTGIDAIHLKEGCTVPFGDWIQRVGDRIGLLGGLDIDLLHRQSTEEISETVFVKGRHFRVAARGFALGTGNAISADVPVDGYLAMIEGAKRIRVVEA